MLNSIELDKRVSIVQKAAEAGKISLLYENKISMTYSKDNLFNSWLLVK